MAQLRREDVVKPETPVMSVSEYVAQCAAPGLTVQSLYYAMDNDLVDHVTFGGREKYLVMTDKTRAYTPNESKKRNHTTMQA